MRTINLGGEGDGKTAIIIRKVLNRADLERLGQIIEKDIGWSEEDRHKVECLLDGLHALLDDLTNIEQDVLPHHPDNAPGGWGYDKYDDTFNTALESLWDTATGFLAADQATDQAGGN